MIKKDNIMFKRIKNDKKSKQSWKCKIVSRNEKKNEKKKGVEDNKDDNDDDAV